MHCEANISYYYFAVEGKRALREPCHPPSKPLHLAVQPGLTDDATSYITVGKQYVVVLACSLLYIISLTFGCTNTRQLPITSSIHPA